MPVLHDRKQEIVLLELGELEFACCVCPCCACKFFQHIDTNWPATEGNEEKGTILWDVAGHLMSTAALSEGVVLCPR